MFCMICCSWRITVLISNGNILLCFDLFLILCILFYLWDVFTHIFMSGFIGDSAFVRMLQCQKLILLNTPKIDWGQITTKHNNKLILITFLGIYYIPILTVMWQNYRERTNDRLSKYVFLSCSNHYRKILREALLSLTHPEYQHYW